MVHPDIHALKFESKNDGSLDPGRMWVGNDGGIFLSKNVQDSQALFFPKNVGLPTFLMENIGQHPTEDAILYGGSQDLNGLKYVGNPVWENVAWGDCANILLDWNNPDNAYIGNTIGNNMFSKPQGAKSPGSGNGTNNSYGNPPTTLVYAPLVGTPYEPSQAGHSKRVAYGSNQVWLSDDWGKNWKSLATMAGNGPGARIKALTFASYGKIYVGTMDGQIYRLSEKSPNWKNERLDQIGQSTNIGHLPYNLKTPITSIAVDPADNSGNSIYITMGGMGDYRRVWHFDGTTQKWEQRSGPNPIQFASQKNQVVSRHNFQPPG